MSPSFEIDIPDKYVDQFRKSLQTIPEAIILRDGAINQARRNFRNSFLQRIIGERTIILSKPIDTITSDTLRHAYKLLFIDAYDRDNTGIELINLVQQSQQIDRLRDTTLTNIHSKLSLIQTLVLIDIYGLVNGIPAKMTEIANVAQTSPPSIRAAQLRALRKMRGQHFKRELLHSLRQI